MVSSITLLMGILMLHFAKNNPSIAGPSFWSSGSFSVVLGIVLFVFFPRSAGMKIVASSIVILGISLYFAGIRSFNKRKINYWLILGIPVAEFVQASLFFSVWPVPYLRIALFSFAVVILAMLIVREYIRPVTKSYRNVYRLGAFVFLILGLASLSKVIFTFVFKPELMMELETVNVALFYVYCLILPILLFVFVLMISIELTERLNEKITSQQEFHSIISHDLIGPVGSISQMLRQINEPENIPEQDRNSILIELEKMSNLTYHLLQNLLLWSRNQLNGLSPTIQTFDLNKVLLQNIELHHHVSKTKNISIFYTENPGLMCWADERMVDTVIRNLLSNAIKFTHPEGKIRVECENAGSNVQIKISDSGIGMSESTLKHLFVNHNQVIKAGTGGDKGTGLGLVLCKHFVEENRGSLKVSSRENVGTEVLVTLPVRVLT